MTPPTCFQLLSLFHKHSSRFNLLASSLLLFVKFGFMLLLQCPVLLPCELGFLNILFNFPPPGLLLFFPMSGLCQPGPGGLHLLAKENRPGLFCLCAVPQLFSCTCSLSNLLVVQHFSVADSLFSLLDQVACIFVFFNFHIF